MNKYIDAEKLKRLVGELKARARRNCCDSWGIVPDALEEVEGFITSLQQEQPETDMKSPFTGGKVAVLSREEEVTFRGEKVKILRKYYRCEDTGREFADSKLDDDMMWTAFRAYCEKKGITSFTDIMLKQEQPEVDLEKEINQLKTEAIGHGHTIDESKSVMRAFERIARRFYELGLNARKEA